MINYQFDTNNETNKKRENMTLKTNKKTTTETINITSSTSDLLITYALIYSNLTVEGKKEAQKQLKLIGENFDLMQEKLKGGK
jgi:hypothetical protein